MARELRFETLFGSTQSADTGDDADSEFRNDSAQIIHVRGITASCSYGTCTADEAANMQISKAPVYNITNNWPFFQRALRLAGPPTGATPADGEVTGELKDKFGRGQLTLEPNESIYINTSKSSGGIFNYEVTLDYEF